MFTMPDDCTVYSFQVSLISLVNFNYHNSCSHICGLLVLVKFSFFVDDYEMAVVDLVWI